MMSFLDVEKETEFLDNRGTVCPLLQGRKARRIGGGDISSGL
jgi:hypothetical protein